MLRNMLRRSGMLALVLALALAGAAPAAALDLDFGGRNLDGWHTVWNWLTDVFGWGDEASGNSGGLTVVYEMEGAGMDPFGDPQPTGATPTQGGGSGPGGP
jgi:hypothetical protein